MVITRISIVALLFAVPSMLNAQRLPEWNQGDHISIVRGDTIILFRIALPKKNFSPSSKHFYFWFDQGQIGFSQGGFTGHLLDGEYSAKLKKGGLVIKGEYAMGLQVGTWREWRPNGILKREVNWKGGLRHGKFVDYNDLGGLLRSGMIDENLMHGKLKEYKNGKLVRTREFNHGVEVVKTPKPPKVVKEKSDTTRKEKPVKRSKKRVTPGDSLKSTSRVLHLQTKPTPDQTQVAMVGKIDLLWCSSNQEL